MRSYSCYRLPEDLEEEYKKLIDAALAPYPGDCIKSDEEWDRIEEEYFEQHASKRLKKALKEWDKYIKERKV